MGQILAGLLVAQLKSLAMIMMLHWMNMVTFQFYVLFYKNNTVKIKFDSQVYIDINLFFHKYSLNRLQ